MIVERFTWTVKPGYMDKFLELIKAEVVKNPQVKCRVYTSNLGKNDTVAEEIEFEDMAKFDKFWEEWFAKSESVEFLNKFDEYREPGGDNFIWNVIDT